MPLDRVSGGRRFQRYGTLPFIDHVYDISGFMNPTIIYYDNRCGSREYVHLVQQALDKPFESFCIVRTLDDVQSNNPVKRQRRKHRVPVEVSTEYPKVGIEPLTACRGKARPS